MKYILFLSFLLTFLPGQNVQRMHVDHTPDYIAVFDSVQALPVSDKCNKKFEYHSEEEFFLPLSIIPISGGKCPAAPRISALTPGQEFLVPYPIRGPPNA
jgi:hypothetical protein